MTALGVALTLAVSAPLVAQDIEPARFAADVASRPIAEAGDTIPASSGAPLRWKSKPREIANPHFAATAQPIAPQQAVRLGWNVTRVDLSVKPAQSLAPATGPSPLNDPFGDRQAGAENSPTLELQPTTTESGVEELPPPRTMSAPKSVLSSTRGAAPPAEIFETAQPMPTIPTPADDARAAGEGRQNVPCERIYNDRNCCENDLNCTAFRNELLTSSIQHISLDITPRYMPDKTAEQNESLRQEALNLLELRAWKSRTGELLATGRLDRYENGAVVVVDESGAEVGRIAWNQLGEDEMCYLNAWWRLPSECTLGGLRTAERHWIPSTFAWHASGLCHKPLYFEDVQLERYGHTTGPYTQPFVSGAHFFLNIATLPYNMAINPPHECVYALGYYRPGSCAPYMIPPVPLSLRGALAEAGVIVGGVYLIP